MQDDVTNRAAEKSRALESGRRAGAETTGSTPLSGSASLDVVSAVAARYSEAANAVGPSLCCPTNYDPKTLEVIPEEVIARDYGCGNPNVHLAHGETGLGSGSGKICFIDSQVVGEHGRVIGVDANPEMLALSRRGAPVVAERIGYANVEFRTGASKISGWTRARSTRKGGRAVISDIVSDEDVPYEIQRDPEAWSGCLSGALREDRIFEEFEHAGFHGIELDARTAEPCKTVARTEFRSVTLIAHKGKQGPCLDRHQAVIYRGPFSEVRDDDGHVLRRGVSTAVCEKTYNLFTQAPYRRHFELVAPAKLPPADEAKPFDCQGTLARDPKLTKGAGAQPLAPAGGDPQKGGG